MISTAQPTVLLDALAADPKGSAQMLARAKSDPEGALRMVAQQFEALVMDIVLKGLRKTLSEESMFDSEATQLYTDLLDQEMSKRLASSGQLGLADLLVNQLNKLNGAVKKDAGSPIT